MMIDYLARLDWKRWLIAALFGQPTVQDYTGDMPVEDADGVYYTVKEATEISGLSRQRLHQFIQDGRLEVKRAGRSVWIAARSLTTLQNRHKPLGRPKKSLTERNNP